MTKHYFTLLKQSIFFEIRDYQEIINFPEAIYLSYRLSNMAIQMIAKCVLFLVYVCVYVYECLLQSAAVLCHRPGNGRTSNVMGWVRGWGLV